MIPTAIPDQTNTYTGTAVHFGCTALFMGRQRGGDARPTLSAGLLGIIPLNAGVPSGRPAKSTETP